MLPWSPIPQRTGYHLVTLPLCLLSGGGEAVLLSFGEYQVTGADVFRGWWSFFCVGRWLAFILNDDGYTSGNVFIF